MKLLAIETSSTACSVALLLDQQHILVTHELAPMQQTQIILSRIEDLLKNNKIKLNQLDAISFGCGPGSFTGIRIATSVAQGLAFGANLPLIPVSSLAAIAQDAYQDLGWEKLIVAIDARINEVYWATYQANKVGIVELLGKEIVCAPEEVSLPPQSGWYGVGNAWQVYYDEIPFKPAKINASLMPTAAAVAKLASIKYQNKEWVTAREAHPVYLRDNVAVKS